MEGVGANDTEVSSAAILAAIVNGVAMVASGIALFVSNRDNMATWIFVAACVGLVVGLAFVAAGVYRALDGKKDGLIIVANLISTAGGVVFLIFLWSSKSLTVGSKATASPNGGPTTQLKEGGASNTSTGEKKEGEASDPTSSDADKTTSASDPNQPPTTTTTSQGQTPPSPQPSGSPQPPTTTTTSQGQTPSGSQTDDTQQTPTTTTTPQNETPTGSQTDGSQQQPQTTPASVAQGAEAGSQAQASGTQQQQKEFAPMRTMIAEKETPSGSEPNGTEQQQKEQAQEGSPASQGEAAAEAQATPASGETPKSDKDVEIEKERKRIEQLKKERDSLGSPRPPKPIQANPSVVTPQKNSKGPSPVKKVQPSDPVGVVVGRMMGNINQIIGIAKERSKDLESKNVSASPVGSKKDKKIRVELKLNQMLKALDVHYVEVRELAKPEKKAKKRDGEGETMSEENGRLRYNRLCDVLNSVVIKEIFTTVAYGTSDANLKSDLVSRFDSIKPLLELLVEDAVRLRNFFQNKDGLYDVKLAKESLKNYPDLDKIDGSELRKYLLFSLD